MTWLSTKRRLSSPTLRLSLKAAASYLWHFIDTYQLKRGSAWFLLWCADVYNFPQPHLQVTLEVALSQSFYTSDSLARFCMLMNSAIIHVGFVGRGWLRTDSSLLLCLIFVSLSGWASVCAGFCVSACVCVSVQWVTMGWVRITHLDELRGKKHGFLVLVLKQTY